MTQGTESARIEQCDRDVAAAYYYSCGGSPKIAREIREGKKDDWFRVKAFAWHRLAAIEATTEAAAEYCDNFAGSASLERADDPCGAVGVAIADELRANKHLETRHD